MILRPLGISFHGGENQEPRYQHKTAILRWRRLPAGIIRRVTEVLDIPAIEATIDDLHRRPHDIQRHLHYCAGSDLSAYGCCPSIFEAFDPPNPASILHRLPWKKQMQSRRTQRKSKERLKSSS
ncbi:hypothetical protein TIFTF001_024273 [Ficus carica]|uniref:Uncharacterized protein n=1 Tax=Ficus carica TaxID=3494 RepID=A0AA88DGS5_FICCA|nr:hypothetical protein TIFTF001_024273 [Ficus carica]